MLPVKDLRIDFIHLTVGKFFKQMAVELAHEKNKHFIIYIKKRTRVEQKRYNEMDKCDNDA